MKNNLLNFTRNSAEHDKAVKARRQIIKSFKAKADARRTGPEKFADFLTAKFGSVFFLSINVVWFVVWIVINTGLIPSINPFDEFPFGLLTMVVSLEAIILAIVVLISQNRETKIGQLREEIELQINTMSEVEVTKLIKMVSLLMEKQGINIEHDEELKEMLKPFNSDQVEKQLEKELEV